LSFFLSLFLFPLTAQALTCPSDMANVQDRFCIDKYEAAIVDKNSKQPASPNYPPSPTQSQIFFDLFQTSPEIQRMKQSARSLPMPDRGAEKQTTFAPLAISVAGIQPQSFLNKVMAEEACTAAGKRLCTREEWFTSCVGPDQVSARVGQKLYPYGPRFLSDKCNVGRTASFSVLYTAGDKRLQNPRLGEITDSLGVPLRMNTGIKAGCTNGYGVYDMVGNLDEIVADLASGGSNMTFVGGFYARSQPGSEQSCSSAVTDHSATGWYDYSVGFRCCADPGASTYTHAGGGSTDTFVSDEDITVHAPSPLIQIPGLSLSPGTTNQTKALADANNNIFIPIPFLGEYLAALYRFGVGATVLIAILMIIVGGGQYILSRGDSSGIETAKKRITQAIIGLLLSVGSYTILYFINPQLVQFTSLQVLYIPGIKFASDVELAPPPKTGIKTKGREWYFDTFGNTEKDVAIESIPNFLGRKNLTVNKSAVDAFTAVQAQVDKTLPGWKGEKVWAFNWRQVKGSSAMSLHAWGIAVDVNPATCPKYEKSSRGQGPDDLCDCDIPDEVIKAFLNNGFNWLGGKGFNDGKTCDAMHFELRSSYFEAKGIGPRVNN